MRSPYPCIRRHRDTAKGVPGPDKTGILMPSGCAAAIPTQTPSFAACRTGVRSQYIAHHNAMKRAQRPFECGELSRPVKQGLDSAEELPSEESDNFAALGVAPGASVSEVRKAYLRLCLMHHPDRNRGNEAALSAFQRIERAYAALVVSRHDSGHPSTLN